jgi:hypothetical protein
MVQLGRCASDGETRTVRLGWRASQAHTARLGRYDSKTARRGDDDDDATAIRDGATERRLDDGATA